MLSVFGDESTDETKQRVFAVAGIIGSDEMWGALEAKWTNRNSSVPFHACDCESDQGDYADQSHADNQNLYRNLAVMLAESGLGGWGFAVDLIAQRDVFPGSPDLAYYKCFLEVVLAMKNCAAFNGETAQFTFDMRRESAYNAGLLYNMLARVPDWQERLFPAIAFECSPERPRLQVADLFARETMKCLDNMIGPIKRVPRKSWLALHNTGRFHVEAIGREWFESLKAQMAALEAKTGMSREDYLDWIQKRGVQHNVTNLFLYMERVRAGRESKTHEET